MVKLVTNAMALTSALYTPIGLTLVLSASLLNHSCNPNSAIVYDGRKVSLHVSEKLEPDTELTISYINTTLSSKTRMSELWDRYHFTCRCSQCSQGLTLGHSIINPSIEPLSSISKMTSMEQEVSALIAEAKSRPTPKGLPQIVEAYQTISRYPEYPGWLSPLYQVRLDLIIALQANKKWVAAFLQSLILHFTVQPIVYPEEAHPTRVARDWVQARMAENIGGCADEPGFAEWLDAVEEGELARALASYFGLDWGLVVYTLVKDVNDQMLKSHGPGTRFGADVERDMLGMKKGARDTFGEPTEEEFEETRLLLRNVASQGWSWLKVWSKDRKSRQLLLTSGLSPAEEAFQKLME